MKLTCRPRATPGSIPPGLVPSGACFGAIADLVAGIAPKQAPLGTKPGGIEPGVARGLQVSFILMLIALAVAGWILLRARQTYPRDVATAAASAEYEGRPTGTTTLKQS